MSAGTKCRSENRMLLTDYSCPPPLRLMAIQDSWIVHSTKGVVVPVLNGFWKMAVLVLVSKAPLLATAQETTWIVDPTLPGQIIHQPASADLRFYEIHVANPLDGSADVISYDALTGEWLAFGQDGIVVGGTKMISPLISTDPKCRGVAVVLCLAAGAALICEIRRNVAVRRAQDQCAASGQGLQIHSQTGCANVRTSCLPRPRFHTQVE